MPRNDLDIIKYGYIHLIIVNELIYVGSSINGNRLKQHLRELHNKATQGEEFSRKLLLEISKLVQDIDCCTKNMSVDEFVKNIKNHAHFEYKVIETNIKITSPKTLKDHEQKHIDCHN